MIKEHNVEQTRRICLFLNGPCHHVYLIKDQQENDDGEVGRCTTSRRKGCKRVDEPRRKCAEEGSPSHVKDVVHPVPCISLSAASDT